MKRFTQWRFILLSALFSLLGMGSAWAQLTELEVGKVYHFTNVNYTGKALIATNPSDAGSADADTENKAQLWYVAEKSDAGYYALRNLAYGTYLQGNGQSSGWKLASTTSSEDTWIELFSVNEKNAIKGRPFGTHGYAHIDNGGNVVGWSSDATSSQWVISEVDMSTEKINEALDFFNKIPDYQNYLNEHFSDKSCTTFTGSFDANDDSFKALPTTLQNMVRKVATSASWEETNYDTSKESWSDAYAKKFRVQMYEPYNEIMAASTALGLNWHSNVNNPTGIFANNGDVLYVMVEGEIKDGATLYLSYHCGHERLSTTATEGYELKQGLNVIPVYTNNSNFYVNYVVNTFDTSNNKRGHQAKARKLSDYPALKIHIEGGHINGYWNKMDGDTDAVWDYLEERATQEDVIVMGQYMTLQFPLNDTNTEGNRGLGYFLNDSVKVTEVINAWDNIMMWERLLLGVLGEGVTNNASPKSPYSSSDHVIEYTGNESEYPTGYGDYYNTHGLAFAVGGDTYMYGVGDHSGYNFNTMGGIIKNMPNNAGNHWGPAHEIGHQHQNLINMRGEMEVSNNLFSNVVLWMYGKTTSRVNGKDGSLEELLKNFNKENSHYLTNNIWTMTQMYYKLFLYYHVLGHNPKFYPRLFEMLRQAPSVNYRADNVDGAIAQLRFYKIVCEAAGEDLTEFFRAHGHLNPMSNFSIDDYGVSTYNLTQAQIDAAIAEVKAQAKSKGWEENTAILFINDATGEPILSHRDDVEYLTHYDVTNQGQNIISSELGCYTTFAESTNPNYTYSISGSTVTMEGEGGIGFAILNDKGEIIAFSNKKTFEVSAEAVTAIALGKAEIVTLNPDSKTTPATSIMDSDNTAVKYELLGNLLDEAKAKLDLSDETGTKVGYYRTSTLTDLQTAYTTAKGVYDAMNVAAYSSVYDVLFQEYDNLVNNEYARINITEGYAYRLTNKAYPDRSMAVGANDVMSGLATDENSDAQLWYFEPGATKGTYYLKNKSTQQYPGDVSTGVVLSANKTEADKGNGAYAYRLQSMGNGIFALVGSTGLHCSSSQSYNIVGWGADAAASQWYITAEVVDETLEARLKLEELIGKTEALVNEIAEYTLVNKLELQTRDNAAANYLSTNACHNTLNNASDGQGLAGLLDESTGTYFHSDYHGTVTDPHYLQVDLGANHTVEQFKFNYTTRDNGNNCPISIKVEGSVDGSTFVELNTFNDGLPNGNALSWVSPVISNEGKYRYLRFTVTEAEGQNRYFVMSTFGLSDVTPVVNEIKEGYANDDASKAQIKATLYELADAHQLVDGDVADASKYNEEIQKLDPYYQKLLKVVNNKLNAALDAKKAELLTLINNTTALIGQCGEVTYTPAMFNGEAPLQVTDENGKFYLSTNAQSNQEGPISGLIDGVVGNADGKTYFHTDYSGSNSTDGLDHYIQVNLGEKVKAFQFTYTNRYNTEGNYATKMTIWGSTDGTTFEEITRIEGLPASASAVYNSEEINATKEYTYLRFMVTESTSAKKGGHYFFHMAEFDLTLIGAPETYTAELNQNIGEVTDDLLIAAYKENAEAQSAHTYATTVAQVEEAIAELQAQYDALLEAKNADPLRAERETANEFLNSTPKTVGYPVAAERKKLQEAIAEATTAADIDEAVRVFKTTAKINMPENGKAYKIKAWWKNEQRYMTFIEKEDASVFAGTESAYVPVQDASKAVTFVCRKIGDDNTGDDNTGDDNTYAFVSDNGFYLGWQADGKKNNTSQNFAVNGHNNTLKIQKAEVNNNGTILQPVDLFGTLNILGKNASDGGRYYHFMFNKISKNYHSGNFGDSYYNDNKEYGHTVYYTFEEVTDYSLNKVNLTATSTDKDKLLKGIADQQTISTFSAPYATLIPEGVTAYYATQEYTGSTLYLKAIEEGLALPANEGVILVGNVGVKAIDFVPATTETVAVIDNEFSNSAAASVVMENNDYILANGNEGIGIYKAQADKLLKQGKAFLRMGSTSNAPRFIMNFGGNATGVEITLTDGATGEQVVYDLYGRRVTEVTKGRLYIVNGKKVFIK